MTLDGRILSAFIPRTRPFSGFPESAQRIHGWRTVILRVRSNCTLEDFQIYGFVLSLERFGREEPRRKQSVLVVLGGACYFLLVS
jgi:hypothetical protein